MLDKLLLNDNKRRKMLHLTYQEWFKTVHFSPVASAGRDFDRWCYAEFWNAFKD